MSKEGWIKLYRQIQDNPLWTSESFTRGQAWVDLILLANHEEGYIYVRDHKITLKRGQVGWSENRLSKRWKWSRTKVRNFLKDLEKEQQINRSKSNSYTIITLINYESFQAKEQQKNNSSTTVVQQKDTNKNEKNVKNEKKIQPAQENSESDEPQHKPSSLFEVKKFFKNNQATEVEAEMFYYHFEEQGWVKGNGMAIVSWHSAAIKWIKKNVNDSKYQTDYSQKVMDGGTW